MMIVFTDSEAEGAIPNGTEVVKVLSEKGDAHRLGSRAVVLGSLGPMELEGLPDMFGYFVEWEGVKGVPVFVMGHKIRAGSAEGE